MVIFSLGISFWAQSKYYKPDLGTFLGSDMDPLGNVYILGVKENLEQYKITKINSKGTVEFEKDLEKSGNETLLIYRNIDIDTSGNIYLVRETRDRNAVVSNPSLYPIAKEAVVMYDANGEEIKQAAVFDFAAGGNMLTASYIRKIQVAGQKLSVVGSEKNRFDVITVNPYVDESPVKEYSFNVNSPDGSEEIETEWVNDVSVLSTGKLFYATKHGDLVAVDPDGTSVNLRSVLDGFENSIVSMSVDRGDNIYFTDLISGNFYKMDTKSINISPVFSIEDSVKIGDIKIRDLRRIRAINEDDFYAASKSFENPFHIRLGTTNVMISNIRYGLIPWGIIFTVSGGLLLTALILGLIFLIKRGFSRIPFAIRITGMFLPVFLIVTSVLICAITLNSVKNYTKVLRVSQSAGAKIIAEKIDGNILETMSASSNYMTPEYARVNLSIINSYKDLKDKVGDTSDYIMVYAAKGNKLYSVADNKYSGDSKSYSELRFADPDMIPAEISLADCFLEVKETSDLYEIWDKLRNGEEKIVFGEFKDVHGKLSASFAPIANETGRIVGMTGNFIDEKTHVIDEIVKMLINASIIMGIFAVIIFLYLCSIVWISLKSLRKLGRGIDAMINGKWKTRISVKSKDEFSDIASSFNEMSGRIENYAKNLISLNKEYLRFVPKELLSLMGKEKITQANINDSKTEHMSILYITFNIAPVRGAIKGDFEGNMFSSLQESYAKIFKIVESSSGIVQNFSILGATVLFPASPKNAVSSAFQISESEFDSKIKENMRICLGFGEVLVGIIGDDLRRGISIVSDEMHRLIKIDNGIKKLGVKFVATESIVEKISEEFALAYRFLGKFRDVAGSSWIKIYEIIDSSDIVKKESHIRTRSIFERAIQLYLDSEFSKARGLFTDVLKQNERDKAALYYLGLCDSKSQEGKNKNFTGDLFECY
ncbi:MAG: HAMP domain-containing protein [Oscillospiraceae bacterium]|nr:HAMP domain-containing protein [Oscillospiraceae bacterium]